METNMDRRSFLIGGTAAGVMAIAGGALAGCSTAASSGSSGSQPSTEANATEGSKATGSADAGKTAPIEPVSPPSSWDAEADIVVVGTGGGGLNAASRARQEGLSVIVVEKLMQPGGNTQSATMFTIPGGTAGQDAIEFGTPAYPFDSTKFTDYIMKGLGQGGSPEMIKHIADNLPNVFNWMTETYKLEWTLGWGGTFYEVQPVGMTKIIEAAYAYAQEMGAEFMLGTEAKALVMDGDRVVGVKAKGKDGNEVYLHGKKAVLLCGGGFAANKDLLAEYCPSAVKRAVSCYLANTDTGDCFRMGLGAGAEITNRNSWVMFDGGMPWEEFGQEWCHYLYDGATQLVRQPWLSIGRDGQRVRYIESVAPGGLTDQATVETGTPGNRTYVLFDANWDEYLQTFNQKACRQPIQDGVARQSYTPEYYQDYHAGVQDAIDAGIIRKFDTLEELAESLELEPSVVKAAVDKWNAMVATGKDDFMYPLKDEYLHPIDTPPYYGAMIAGNIFSTSTGLLINTKMQVLSTGGSPIPGLYAGWHTAGGAGADDVVGSMLYDTGGVSRSYLGGYLAVGSIAAEE